MPRWQSKRSNGPISQCPKSVLNMQSHGCFSLADQIMTAGASESMSTRSTRSCLARCRNWKEERFLSLAQRISVFRDMTRSRTGLTSQVSKTCQSNAKRTSKGACQTETAKGSVWPRKTSWVRERGVIAVTVHLLLRTPMPPTVTWTNTLCLNPGCCSPSLSLTAWVRKSHLVARW